MWGSILRADGKCGSQAHPFDGRCRDYQQARRVFTGFNPSVSAKLGVAGAPARLGFESAVAPPRSFAPGRAGQFLLPRPEPGVAVFVAP